MNDSDAKEHATPSPKVNSTNDDDDKSKRETYYRFVEALEKHGTSRKNAWDNISADMGWSIKDVKAYAFSYMLKLHEMNTRPDKENDKKLQSGYEEKRFSSLDKIENEKSSIWTYEECIFFDNLMARYFTEENDICDIISKIAELIPSKTKPEVRMRIMSYSK